MTTTDMDAEHLAPHCCGMANLVPHGFVTLQHRLGIAMEPSETAKAGGMRDRVASLQDTRLNITILYPNYLQYLPMYSYTTAQY